MRFFTIAAAAATFTAAAFVAAPAALAAPAVCGPDEKVIAVAHNTRDQATALKLWFKTETEPEPVRAGKVYIEPEFRPSTSTSAAWSACAPVDTVALCIDNSEKCKVPQLWRGRLPLASFGPVNTPG